ncbi:MAG: NAD(P)H-dependent oxidoreductase, partial [Clostridiales bacterium]|nr:NAD(P)H-dependent oxidoreductase [Clostridiales bacterium]
TPLCAYDDLDEFFKDFEDAELIVIATPVYNTSFPAPLKALFDRFQRYYSAYFALGRVQPVKSRRNAVLLASAGHDGKYALEVMTRQCKSSFSVMNTSLVGSVLAPDTDECEIPDNIFGEARQLAESITKGVL